jgi:hypothetical protein
VHCVPRMFCCAQSIRAWREPIAPLISSYVGESQLLLPPMRYIQALVEEDKAKRAIEESLEDCMMISNLISWNVAVLIQALRW